MFSSQECPFQYYITFQETAHHFMTSQVILNKGGGGKTSEEGDYNLYRLLVIGVLFFICIRTIAILQFRYKGWIKG